MQRFPAIADYPDELKESPVPVVALMGQKELHGLISKHLSTSSQQITNKDFPSMHLLSLEANEALPERKKERKTTFENYIAGGILKSSWMYRHKQFLPSVVILIMSWEKNLKENELFTSLEIAR